MTDINHQENMRLLSAVLNQYADLELAVLVGSRAENRSRPDSDWDIAIQWTRDLSTLENLSQTETLRRDIASHLSVNETLVDLIHLPSARLAMRALVAEKGTVIKGQDCLAWNHFLSRTWRELEDYDWGKQHAS